MTELSDIAGLGNTYEAKLEQAGISSVNDLANAQPEDVVEAGIPESKAEGFVNAARQKGVLMEPAPAVEQEQTDKEYVTTGMQAFDSMLGGGWEPGFVYGVAGEHRSGKTQLMFQALVAAARHHGPAIYIETEPERFRADRIKSMCDSKETYKNIYKVAAHSLDQQKVAYDAVVDEFDDAALVVIDSFTALLRLSGDFQGRENLPDRTTEIVEHLSTITEEFDCPVLLTLQVMGNPDPFGGSLPPIWGGMLMEHAVTAFIYMRQSKGQLREGLLRGHPGRQDGEVTIKIKDSGLEAMES